MTRAGGFRTRFIPSWARLLWGTLLQHMSRQAWDGSMALVWEYQWNHDKQRVCPHAIAIKYPNAAGVVYVDCRDCGKHLRTERAPWWAA